MRKINKRGFTIVELVIVIAVIAILAGVMIPTFSAIVDKAQRSAALQEAKNNYTLYLENVDRTTQEVHLDALIEIETGKYAGQFIRIVDGAVQSEIVPKQGHEDWVVAKDGTAQQQGYSDKEK